MAASRSDHFRTVRSSSICPCILTRSSSTCRTWRRSWNGTIGRRRSERKRTGSSAVAATEAEPVTAARSSRSPHRAHFTLTSSNPRCTYLFYFSHSSLRVINMNTFSTVVAAFFRILCAYASNSRRTKWWPDFPSDHLEAFRFGFRVLLLYGTEKTGSWLVNQRWLYSTDCPSLNSKQEKGRKYLCIAHATITKFTPHVRLILKPMEAEVLPEFAPFDRSVHSSVHLICGVKQFLYLPETYSLHFEINCFNKNVWECMSLSRKELSGQMVRSLLRGLEAWMKSRGGHPLDTLYSGLSRVDTLEWKSCW